MRDQAMNHEGEDGDGQDAGEDVIVVFRLSNQSMGTKAEREKLEALAAELDHATHEARVGDYEGDEFGGGECLLFFSGDDPARLTDVLRARLKKSPIGSDAKITRSVPGDDGAERRQASDP